MPNVRQGGGYALTFSKRNKDVQKILDEYKKDKSFVSTEYICNAIRFYEKYKDNIENSINIDINKLKRDIIHELNIEEVVKNEIEKNFNLKKDNSIKKNLECDLEHVSIDED